MLGIYKIMLTVWLFFCDGKQIDKQETKILNMFNKKDKTLKSQKENIENKVIQETENQSEVAEQAQKQAPQEELSAEEKLKQDNEALNDKYLRLFAEFDNYKRRTQKERIELLQTAGKDVVISLLPVLDDFERAVKAIENATEIGAVREGIVLVQTKIKSILSQKGLKEIESLHTEFDTDKHEAITKVTASGDDMKGKVVDELEKGYTFNDKIIRFAKVVVGA